MKAELGKLTRQRVSEAFFLIGIGVIWAFDLWWPGILVVFGVTWSASLMMRKRYWAATLAALLLCVLPVVYLTVPAWEWVVPASVAGAGVAELARAIELHRRARMT